MKRKAFASTFWLAHLLLLLGSGSGQSTVSSVPGAPTTPGPITSAATPGSSVSSSTVTAASNTSTTTATPSDVTSTSSPAAGNQGSQTGQLRPWEVALIAMASVAMAVILTAGVTASLKNSPCLRNLTPNVNHDHGQHPQGYQRPRATGPGFRDQSPPVGTELTGRHCA